MDKIISDMKRDLLAHMFATLDACKRGDEQNAAVLNQMGFILASEIAVAESFLPKPAPNFS
jgi:hypothetical protein